MYCKWIGNSLVLLGIYVDDIIVAADEEEHLKSTVSFLSNHFELKQLGPLTEMLGISFNYDHVTQNVTLNQSCYIDEVLQRYNMLNVKDREQPLPSTLPPPEQGLPIENADLYRAIIGAVLYINVASRPDISFPISLLSRYVECPTKYHWTLLKQLLGFLKFSKNAILSLRPLHHKHLAYSDADFGSTEGRYSMSGAVVLLFGCPVHWYTRRQKRISRSTVESEFLAATTLSQTMMGLLPLFKLVYSDSLLPYPVAVDSTGALALITTGTPSSKSKHIEVDFAYCRSLIERNILRFEYVSTKLNLADLFTKSLPKLRFIELSEKCGMIFPKN